MELKKLAKSSSEKKEIGMNLNVRGGLNPNALVVMEEINNLVADWKQGNKKSYEIYEIKAVNEKDTIERFKDSPMYKAFEAVKRYVKSNSDLKYYMITKLQKTDHADTAMLHVFLLDKGLTKYFDRRKVAGTEKDVFNYQKFISDL